MVKNVITLLNFIPEKYSELFNNVELHTDSEYWEV